MAKLKKVLFLERGQWYLIAIIGLLQLLQQNLQKRRARLSCTVYQIQFSAKWWGMKKLQSCDSGCVISNSLLMYYQGCKSHRMICELSKRFCWSSYLIHFLYPYSYFIIVNRDTKLNKGTIIRPYKPNALWLSKQWQGTVLQYVWRQVIVMMLLTALFGLIVCFITGDMSPYADAETSEHPLLYQLELVGGWWSMYVYLSHPPFL